MQFPKKTQQSNVVFRNQGNCSFDVCLFGNIYLFMHQKMLTKKTIKLPTSSLKSHVQRYTVRLLTQVLCKPTHFVFQSFIATIFFSLQTSFSSAMKDWAEKYHVSGTPTRSPSRSWQHFKMKFLRIYGRELCYTLELIPTRGGVPIHGIYRPSLS